MVVTALTVATKSDGFYPQLLQAAEHYNIHLETLGWQQQWTGFLMKNELVKNRLESARDIDIFLVIDGYDVLFANGTEDLESFYKEHAYGKLYVSSDTYHSNPIGRFFHNVLFGHYEGHVLCAGVYIGNKEALEHFNNFVLMTADKTCKDDQYLLTKYAKLYPQRIAVDTKFFQTVSRIDKSPFDPEMASVTWHGTCSRDLKKDMISLPVVFKGPYHENRTGDLKYHLKTYMHCWRLAAYNHGIQTFILLAAILLLVLLVHRR